MTMKINPILQQFATPSRYIGLGKEPSKDVVTADVMGFGFSQMPVIEYVTWTMSFPLSDPDITATFGSEINLLSTSGAPAGVAAEASSFVVNGVLQVDMFVAGFGIHVFGEPVSFSVIGNAMTPIPGAATPPIASLDAFTQHDLANGCLGQPQGGSVIQAELEWGVADWEAAWHLANGYRFIWWMNQRYAVVNELAADVCYFGPYAEATAAGTSEVPVQPFVRQVNNQYRSMAGGGIFVPINFRRVGSVTSAAQGNPNVGVVHPTRDFDLAPVTWGGIRNQGGAASAQPFRKLPKPVLLERGIPIGMKLIEADAFHAAQMRRYMSISESLGGNLATVGLDAQVNGLTNTGAAVALELTLDQGANVTIAQQVQTDRAVFKGGAFQLSILLKGFEVWSDAWKDYILGRGGNLAGHGTVGAPAEPNLLASNVLSAKDLGVRGRGAQ